MNLQLHIKDIVSKQKITVSGSKSESNRLLILQKLYPEITIQNLSNSDDSMHLQHALSTKEKMIDIGHAGTAMRFLTAFFASQEGKTVILTGSERMQNRPIKILVDALNSLGADIAYVDKEGYPPLKIIGKKLTKNKVQIDGNVSSQYISALLLIAANLENGLSVKLIGKITSVPYINMTLSLLKQVDIECSFEDDLITVLPKKAIKKQTIVVESDWSSASYYYSMIALSLIGTEITLSAYKKDSLQGDMCLSEIYEKFGIETTFNTNSIRLIKTEKQLSKHITLQLQNAPDIAQTIAITCLGLHISCTLTGLHTLKIKETDRLVALKNELEKCGGKVRITDESLHLKPTEKITKNATIQTYNDHRMAMAFVPLALKNSLIISDANVVTKSYKNFWKDMQQIGFQTTEV